VNSAWLAARAQASVVVCRRLPVDPVDGESEAHMMMAWMVENSYILFKKENS